MGKTLVVQITGDTRKLQQALSGTQSGMQKLGRTARIAGLAIAGGLAVAFKVGLDEMVASQKVMAQTEAVIKSTGGAANVTATHVDELAQQLLALSGVDDELISASENVLLTFRNVRNEVGEGNDIFDQATKATLDFSTAMGLELNSAALSVGKALNDPIKGMTKLQRQGVTFTAAQEKLITSLVESGDVMGAQKMILAELTKEFGGSAEAAGTTLPAQLARAKEAFADVTAGLVEQLLPAMTAVLSKLLRFTEFLKENPKLAKAMAFGIFGLAGALFAASAAQTALNLAVLANPYVAAAAVAIALISALAVLAKKTGVVTHLWEGFLLVISPFAFIVMKIAQAVQHHFGTVEDVFNKIKEVAGRVFPAIEAYIRGLLSPILDVINAVERLIGLISRVHLPFGIGSNPGASGLFSGTGQGPRGGSALGGIVRRGGLERVHTGEAIVPARVARGGHGEIAMASGRGRFLVLTDAEGVAFLQSLNTSHMRGNGGRSIW